MTVIKTKRAYDTPEKSDGYRILVDRLWPRGLTHERLDCPLWAKDIAPSTGLREWYHADTADRWAEFQSRYKAELEASADFPTFIKTVEEHPTVTFVYAGRDEVHNEAVILKNLCDSKMK